jgi:hypothetical protein
VIILNNIYLLSLKINKYAQENDFYKIQKRLLKIRKIDIKRDDEILEATAK